MKRALSLALILCLLLGLTGCGGAEPAEEAAPRIRVGILHGDPAESPYRAASARDFQETFTEENGYDAVFSIGSDHEEQLAAARQMVADGVDYLVLSAAEASGWDEALRTAQDAGVPVILFDRAVDADESLYAACVASDFTREGELAVDWLERQRLPVYNIIHLQGTLGSAAQAGRSGPLQDKVDAEETWHFAAQECASWSAEAAESILAEVIRAGQSFNVVYAENDNMARGAQAALEAAGGVCGVEVLIVAFDGSKFALQKLVDGQWNYDGQCSPLHAAAVDGIIRGLEQGVQPPKTVFVDETGFEAGSITQEDVENYGI